MKESYKKSNFVKDISEKYNIKPKEAELAINTIFNDITDALLQGKRVEIRGLGTFLVKKYRGYTGRNPQNKETIKVKPKTTPFFKAGLIKEKFMKINES